jgi:hypothetical protein
MKRRIKIFALLMVAALFLLAAGIDCFAATYPVTPSQSAATIQGVISGASAGDTVSFSAGTFNISQALTLKCGVTYTGPGATPATAILNATFALESASIFNIAAGCTSGATTIEYLDFLNDGALYAVASVSNVTIDHVQVGNLPCCHNIAHDSAIFLDTNGNSASNGFSGFIITNNTFGDTNSCIAPQNAMTDFDSPEDYQGVCGGLQVNWSVNGLVLKNNTFVHLGESVHFLCPGDRCEPTDSPAGPTTKNVTAMYNDFVGIHRIAWEEQPQVTQNVVLEYNSEHDPINPYFGNFALSMACCDTGATAPGATVINNTWIQNTAPHIRYGYGLEAWGNNAVYDHNLIQNGSPVSGNTNPAAIAWCYGMLGGSVSNNTVQGPNYDFGGSSCGGNNAIGNECVNNGGTPRCAINPPWSPGTVTGNVTGSTIGAVTSVAPSISPSPGSYSGPITVTLTDPGYTSGPQPLANTSIWYTTDGSTPVPGSGTTKLYTLPFALSLPATVKAVGMWGSGANTISYPSGYGFVPSAVQTAAYSSSGGGVTLSSVTIAATAGVSNLNLGQTVQMIVTCHYSDGSSNGCNTTDAHGNSVTAWASSNGNVSVSSSGLATGAAIGTANISATVTGGLTTSPAYTLTVSASPLTLTSVSLATAGGVSSITAGATNQLLGTCHYSDGASASCDQGMDSHGNVIGSWSSSAPSSATVNGAGNTTGVAAGSTNLSATVNPAPSMLGTNVEDTTGFTNNGYINEIYGVTGTSAGSYTPGNCNINIPATTWTAGKLWTCLLVLGTPTTQQSSALCSNSYTTTGTSWPGGNISISMASCGALPPDQGYWLASTTNQTTTNPAQGFTHCGGSCSGGRPAFGSGTYAYRYVANTFGNYTSLPTTLNATSGGLQVSQYLTLTTTPVTSANLPLTINAAPPTLVSAHLTASTSSLVVPNTLQMAARCHYSSGADQDCTVADIYGDAVTSWVSSDTSKATIGAVGSANPGLVTAVAAGTPAMTAVINGGLSSSAYPITITTTAVTLTGLSLSTAGGVTGLFVGSTNQLKATCSYSDASTDDCTTTDPHGTLAHSWTSTTPAHATVNSSSGLATGVAPGTTTFTAVAGSFTSNAIPLTVFAVLSGVYTITISGPVTFSGTVRF